VTAPWPASADGHPELAVAWALHALEPDEAEVFAVHLDDCPACVRIVAETEDVATMLGTAVEQVEPPASLRAAVLGAAGSSSAGGGVSDAGGSSAAGGRVSDAASLTSDVSDARSSADGASTPAPVAADDGAVVPIRRHRAPEDRRGRWERRVTAGVAVAAVLAVVAAIGGLVAANRSLTEQRDRAAAAAAQGEQVTQLLDAAAQPGNAHAVLATPQGGFVGLVVDRGRGPEMLASGLTPNDSEHTYVLWGLADGRPVGLSAFGMSGSGPVVQSVPSVAAAGRFAGFAVSLEPGHAVPATPTQVVASGQTAG
jgi:hypothetical protein